MKNSENKFDGTRNTSRTADQDDFMNIRLGIAKDLNRANTATEDILAELFETSTSKGSAGIDTSKRVLISRLQKKAYA